MNHITIVVLFTTLISCSFYNTSYTKVQRELVKVVDEFCAHSKEHRDLILLGASDAIGDRGVYVDCEDDFKRER